MDLQGHLDEFRAGLGADFIPRLEAQRFVERMEDEDPSALLDWIFTHAVEFVARELNDMLGRERRRAVKRAEYSALTDAMETGLFKAVYEVGPDHSRRVLGDMTGADHAFVRAKYRVNGGRLLLLSAVFEQLERRCGPNRTRDVMSEPECAAIFKHVLTHPEEEE